MNKSFRVCNEHLDVWPQPLVVVFFSFLNTQQNKHCLEARSPGGKSKVQRSHFFFVCYFLALYTLVLLGWELLLPGLIQVNQSLVVEDKENEVQCICGDTDDAEVL